MGGLLAGGGHVTQAFLALTPRLGWQAYHWMGLWTAIGRLIDVFTPTECANYFAATGYDAT